MPAAHGMRSRFFGSRLARVVSLLLLAMLFGAPIAWSQRQRFMLEPNVPYDGRYTFVRLRYTQGYRMAWSADYPQMERNFMTILGDLSTLRLHKKASNVHVLDDPALNHYPIAYLTEPGYWMPTPQEAEALRRWIQKGGFLIVDDFYFDRQWDVFEKAMLSVLPTARIVPTTLAAPCASISSAPPLRTRRSR